MFRFLGKPRSSSAPDIPVDPIETNDIWLDFRSLEEWLAWKADHPESVAIEEARAIAEHAKANGVLSDFLGAIPAASVVVNSANFREDLNAAGFNPRLRVVLDRLIHLPGADDIWNFRIHGHEALTPFALALRGRYPLYLGSEYTADAEAASKLYPIPVIDVMRSGLPDEVFDLIVSNEVLEHVPDLDAALRDSARILKAGGTLLATFPFGRETSIRAVAEADGIRFLAPPEYHGNPVDPERGSLVFQIPGWDILSRARAAGFQDARITYASSRRKAYTGSRNAGIFLFEATK
jgi:hypothetical protein